MNIFEIDISYINNNYSSADVFFIGLTHAFSFAIPFSPPLLICLRRLLVQGIPSGIVSFLGTAVGQTLFTAFLLFGFRDIIQFWYDWEPVLYLIGVVLSLSILFNFFNDSRLKVLNSVSGAKLASFFVQNLVLVFLNPVSAINTSRFITNQEILGLNATFVYLSSFFIGVFGFSCLFGFLFYLLRNWLFVVSLKPYTAFMRPINKGLVIISISLILNVTAKFTWHLFLQHPGESFLNNIEIVEGFLPVQASKETSIRKFPVFDSNIKNRERHLPVFRHFGVDSLKQQRVWANKPPLTESQLETVYFRYNIHIVNKLSDWVNKTRFNSRTPFVDQSTPEQIKRLKQVKSDYLQIQSAIKTPSLNQQVQNKGKGNPVIGYAQEKLISADSPTSNYLHPDLESTIDPTKPTTDLDFFLTSLSVYLQKKM